VCGYEIHRYIDNNYNVLNLGQSIRLKDYETRPSSQIDKFRLPTFVSLSFTKFKAAAKPKLSCFKRNWQNGNSMHAFRM